MTDHTEDILKDGKFIPTVELRSSIYALLLLLTALIMAGLLCLGVWKTVELVSEKQATPLDTTPWSQAEENGQTIGTR